MWKVLIADDEPKIRRGLKSLIERIDPETQVVAEAEDGEAALEQARETTPDILFIDIRMPFINGLELAERLGGLGRDWIVIVVTGHDEFEYARKALSLKVFDFLLKPVTEEQIRKTLDRAKSELSMRRDADKYVAWARERLAENMDALRQAFLRDWISGALSVTEIEESASFLSLSLPKNPAITVVHIVERVMSVGALKEGYRRLMTYAVKSIVEEAFGEKALVVIDESENVVALCAADDAAIAAATEAIEEAVEESTHQTPLIATIRAGTDGGTSPGRSVSEAYEDASAELARRGSYEAFVLLAQSYIDKHCAHPDLSLEETAAEIQISPGYLSRLMKQSTGFSFVEYLTRARINKALKLMADPTVKVFEVADRVGYRSQHYFSRAFRKVLGVSPSEYKKGGTAK
jgi:two-component system response regulator YesN